MYLTIDKDVKQIDRERDKSHLKRILPQFEIEPNNPLLNDTISFNIHQ
jgi:hypothetical protein